MKIHSDIKHPCDNNVERHYSHSFVIYAGDDLVRNSLIKRFNGQEFHARIVEAREHISC